MLLRFFLKPNLVAMNTARMFGCGSAYTDPVKARISMPAPEFSGMAWTDN